MQYVVWRSVQYAVCVQEECGGLTTGSGSRLPPQLYLLLAQLLGHLNILSFFSRVSHISDFWSSCVWVEEDKG